jgi:hypothetical protein
MPLNWSSGPLEELSEFEFVFVVSVGCGVVALEPTADVDDIIYSATRPGFRGSGGGPVPAVTPTKRVGDRGPPP